MSYPNSSINYYMVYCFIQKSKFLNFLLIIKISYFLFFRYVKNSWSTST